MPTQLESVAGELFVNGAKVITESLINNSNLITNGMLAIDQRSGDPLWVADRWKKSVGGMTQTVEEFSYLPSEVHTLSYDGGNAQQVTSPATGHWTLPEIPTTARKIKLEQGSVATTYQVRPLGEEMTLCQRYYEVSNSSILHYPIPASNASVERRGYVSFKVIKHHNADVAIVPYTVAPTIATYDLNGFRVTMSASSTTAEVYLGTWTAEAEI